MIRSILALSVVMFLGGSVAEAKKPAAKPVAVVKKAVAVNHHCKLVIKGPPANAAAGLKSGDDSVDYNVPGFNTDTDSSAKCQSQCEAQLSAYKKRTGKNDSVILGHSCEVKK